MDKYTIYYKIKAFYFENQFISSNNLTKSSCHFLFEIQSFSKTTSFFVNAMVLEVLIIDVDSAIDEIDSLLLFPVRIFEAFS